MKSNYVFSKGVCVPFFRSSYQAARQRGLSGKVTLHLNTCPRNSCHVILNPLTSLISIPIVSSIASNVMTILWQKQFVETTNFMYVQVPHTFNSLGPIFALSFPITCLTFNSTFSGNVVGEEARLRLFHFSSLAQLRQYLLLNQLHELEKNR